MMKVYCTYWEATGHRDTTSGELYLNVKRLQSKLMEDWGANEDESIRVYINALYKQLTQAEEGIP